MTLRRLQTQAQEIVALKAEVEKLSTSCGHCGELEAAFERAETARAAALEEAAAVADRLECPAIARAIRDLTKAEETKPCE